MCVDMGSHTFGKRWVHKGFSKRGVHGKGGSQGGSQKGGGSREPYEPPWLLAWAEGGGCNGQEKMNEINSKLLQ